MNDKHFNNKISLWIKQRLFVSRKYDETMNALEKFSNEMKTIDELQAVENEQRAEKDLPDNDEQRRISLVIPPLSGELKIDID
jgi:hypothetical protein